MAFFQTGLPSHSLSRMAQSEQQGSDAPTLQSQLIINLRDISDDMVKAWQGAFKGEKYKNVKVSRYCVHLKSSTFTKTDQ